MSPEIEVLEQFFDAINRNDLDAVARHFDPQVERIEPEGFATSGLYRGIASVRQHIAQGRGSWAEGSCDPEKFLVNGDKIVVYLHARVRLTDATEWIDGRFADGFVMRDCKIALYQTFWTRSEALAWAGLEVPDAAPMPK